MIWLLTGLKILQEMNIICQTPQPGHFHPACRNLLFTSFTRRRWEVSQFLPGPTLGTRCGRSNFPTSIYQRYNSIYMAKTESSFHINNHYMYFKQPRAIFHIFAVALQLQLSLNSRLEKDIDIETSS